MLSLKNIFAGYTKGSMILKGIELEVGDNEVVAIVGQNGFGKSTLAKSIMNLVPYKEGVVAFNEEDISKFQTHEISKLGIAFFMQGGRIFPNLSVRENLLFAAAGLSKNEYIKRNDQLKLYFELLKNKRMNLQASYLSGDEQHQLALAMVLMRKPEFLILDEPSAGLSLSGVDNFYRIIKTIHQEFIRTILILEQNFQRLIGLCNRIPILEQGKIVKDIEVYQMNILQDLNKSNMQY